MATDDLQRLIVSLEAKISTFEKAMNRASGIADRRAKTIEERFRKMNRNISSTFAAPLRSGLAFAGIGLGAKGFQELADAAIRTQNSLKVAGLAGDDLKRVYGELFASAQRNAAPIETLAELYGKAALVQNELKVSTSELINFTDKVAVALRISGQSAEASSGALRQLGQALGSGVVRAEEFNSVLEGALPVAQAVAAGLKEAGGSVAKLRQLITDGKISSEAFFRAFEAGASLLDDKVANSTFTLGQRFVTLKNSLVDAVGKFDDAVGVSSRLGGALQGLSTNVQDVGDYFERNRDPIDKFFDSIADGFSRLEKAKKRFRESVGLTALDDFLEGTSLIEGKIGFASSQGIRAKEGETPYGPNFYGPFPPPSSKTIKPVSLSDFAPPTAKTKGGRSRSDYDHEMASLQERTDLIRAETAARAKLNPLAEDYQQQIDKAVAKQRLLSAAQQQGIAITPQLEASIDSLASGYAAASAEAETLAQRHEALKEAAQEMRSLGKDVMSGFISDLREGTSAAESLGNALNRIADKMIDMALNNIFSAPGTAQPGFFQGLGALFGFRDGGVMVPGKGPARLPTFARGGVSKSAAIFGEAGPEAAVPLPDGRRIPVDLRLPQSPKMTAPAAAPALNFSLSPVFNVQNGTADGVAKLKSDLMPSLQKMVKNELNDAFDRSGRFARLGV